MTASAIAIGTINVIPSAPVGNAWCVVTAAAKHADYSTSQMTMRYSHLMHYGNTLANPVIDPFTRIPQEARFKVKPEPATTLGTVSKTA